MPNQNQVKYVPAGRDPLYWGPGDKVTGVQSGGACFIGEVMVPPGGGPPPHIHYFEKESFYLLQRRLHMILGQVVAALAACVEFLAIPILAIVIFAALMIAEVGNRRRPEMWPQRR